MNQNKQPDPRQMNELYRAAASQLGMQPEAVQHAVQAGSADALLRTMSPQDAEQLRRALADKNTTARILASPQAKAILKKLFQSDGK